MIATLIIVGLLLLPVIYNLVFPFKKPYMDNYFTPGLSFTSTAEGVTQTVIKQDGNKVYCETKFEAKAIGPPEHLHLSLDESATVVKGTLTTKVGGEIKKPEKADDYLPIELAYSLSQLYPLMKPRGGLTLKMFAKICVLDELFDTIVVGPPPPVFKAIKKTAKPYARLFGVTPYDDKSKPK